MQPIACARSKLILFGEHAAVYGYPAIGMPLPWKVTVTLKPALTTRWSLEPTGEKLNNVLEKIPELFPIITHFPPFEIHIASEIPIGVGFGSSGALCVALVRAIVSYIKKKPLSDYDLWRHAHELEKAFHLHPSGIDTGLSVFEKTCYFEGQETGLPTVHFIEENPLHLVVGAVDRNSDTAQLIKKIKPDDPGVKKHLGALGQIAKEAAKIVGEPSVDIAANIGTLANQAHHHLSSLGLSTKALDTIISEGISCGATGGKLSGAGGGGAFFLVARSKDHAKEIARACGVRPAGPGLAFGHLFQGRFNLF